MWFCHQIILLFCIVRFLRAQSPSPTKNPECGGMNTASKHMETGLKALPSISQAHCKPNKHCTGVSCSWSGDGSLEVDLHHCTEPVSYHVLFKNPGFANENITLHEGDDKSLYDKNHATAKIKVTKLERSENIITTSVVLETCLYRICRQRPLITQQTFCVKMENCPGFNASAHHYKPCGNVPTGHPNTTAAHAKSTPTGRFSTAVSPKAKASTPSGHFNTTVSPKTKASTSSGHIKTAVPETIPTSSPSGHVKTAASLVPETEPTATSAGHSKPPSSSRKSTPSAGHSKPPSSSRKSTPSDKRSDGNAAHRKGSHKGDSSGRLSTGAIVGISVACGFAILVVVGAAVYWKKYNYRYRLRAAYYNDISMYEPLCEDFGPEVA